RPQRRASPQSVTPETAAPALSANRRPRRRPADLSPAPRAWWAGREPAPPPVAPAPEPAATDRRDRSAPAAPAPVGRPLESGSRPAETLPPPRPPAGP